MAWKTFDQYNTTEGLATMFQYSQATVPFFADLLFGVILVILTMGLYFGQEAKKGVGDFPVAFAVGCTATTVLAVLMGMISNFLPFRTLGTLIGVTIISYFWLFFSKDK